MSRVTDHKRRRKAAESLMFKDLPQYLQDLLRGLSRNGYIYLGKTGPGLTYPFRKETMKLGTVKAIDEHMDYEELEAKLLVELIAVEGPRWVSYARVLEYCHGEVFQLIRAKGA